MALTKCPECGNTISDKEITCPHCGYVVRMTQQQAIQPQIEEKNRNWGVFFIIAIVALIAFITWEVKREQESKRIEYTELIYKKLGIRLKGNYTNEELRLISQGGKRYILSNNALADKIYEQEGLTTLDIPDN